MIRVSSTESRLKTCLNRLLQQNLAIAREEPLTQLYRERRTVAWRRVAEPFITAFERREIRNHNKESDEKLRYHLG